ncbi:sensor histidine kinase [Streptomyces sp. NPDC059918]|uniref:sensor histidine kinase n=1 Tax=unclassified Streptomyces TaxID=2593676 RepID=UPI00365BA0DB
MTTTTPRRRSLAAVLGRLTGSRHDEFDEMPSDGHDALTHVFEVYQLRALRLQAVLRVVLAVAVAVEIFAYPPRLHPTAIATVTALYGAYTVAVLVLVLRWRHVPLRALEWSVPLVDLPFRAALLTVSGAYSDPEWSNPFTSAWLFMMVIVSAFQLRPVVTAVTGALATVFYFVASTVGHAGEGAVGGYIVGNTVSIALVTLASVLISHIQQDRAQSISRLAHRRASMLAATLSVVDRDRRDLAEALHDGPLQSVLSARLDIDEVTQDNPYEALERADEALRDATRHLRSSVTDLHPAVLERAGLPRALEELAERTAQRGRFTVDVRSGAESAGHDADRLLYSCTREFLTNIVKHARASHVTVRFDVTDGRAVLSVADDGVGLAPAVLQERLAQGHIGLASQRLRIEEAGGHLTMESARPRGTVVRVSLPVPA